MVNVIKANVTLEELNILGYVFYFPLFRAQCPFYKIRVQDQVNVLCVPSFS